jgi:hypothetical protein
MLLPGRGHIAMGHPNAAMERAGRKVVSPSGDSEKEHDMLHFLIEAVAFISK